MHRRLKYALEKAGIGVALGGIDFSFNEDRDGNYKPFWSPHVYLITATNNLNHVGRSLKAAFNPNYRVPRPIKISLFRNNALRRSYALKMNFYRRIGYDEIKVRDDGTTRKCRNTSTDELRAKERLELFIYLDKIGLASRVIFRGAKPIQNSSAVRIRGTRGYRITRSRKNGKR